MASSSASSKAILNAASPGPEFRKCETGVSGTVRRPFRHTDARAQRADFTIRTIRVAGVAAAAAMPNEPMAEHGPLWLGHQRHQLLLYLDRVNLASEAEPL